jgi:hypothetical protein
MSELSYRSLSVGSCVGVSKTLTETLETVKQHLLHAGFDFLLEEHTEFWCLRIVSVPPN